MNTRKAKNVQTNYQTSIFDPWFEIRFQVFIFNISQKDLKYLYSINPEGGSIHRKLKSFRNYNKFATCTSSRPHNKPDIFAESSDM